MYLFYYLSFIIFTLLYANKGLSATKICLGYCDSQCTCPADKNYFQCKNKQCIDFEKYRNYNFDCDDKSDEAVECCPNEFLCDFKDGMGACLESELMDNGVIDCIDGSDESNENFKTCQDLRQAELDAGLTNTVYECKLANGSSSPKCIPVSHLLDGNKNHGDCPTGDDEDPAKIDECLYGIHDCDKANGICTNIPDGAYYCTCKVGYSGNGYTCIAFGGQLAGK